ncbi:hypothetical protein ABE458_23805 [Pseudomonas protegens]|uniref:hypothetical protein n=1 Tax=Pseudomonas TaxID=286 RepID=UPI003209ED8C
MRSIAAELLQNEDVVDWAGGAQSQDSAFNALLMLNAYRLKSIDWRELVFVGLFQDAWQLRNCWHSGLSLG